MVTQEERDSFKAYYAKQKKTDPKTKMAVARKTKKSKPGVPVFIGGKVTGVKQPRKAKGK